MMTANEEKVLRLVYENPGVSLRDMVEKLGLGGVASAAHVVSALERKGYLRKVGTATKKRYELTQLAFETFARINFSDLRHVPRTPDISNSPLDARSTSAPQNEAPPAYWSGHFPNASTGPTDDLPLGTFLSASVARIINSPDGWSKHGDAIVLALVLAIIVLPAARLVLGDQWALGLVVIGSFSLVAIIINKK
jgi:hypothetical protein